MKSTKYHKISDLVERVNSEAANEKRKIQTESINGVGKLQPGDISNQTKVNNQTPPPTAPIHPQPGMSK